MQPVLITGANGFVGNYLSEYLAATSTVLATGKGDCRFSFSVPALTYAPLDITDREAVATLIDAFKPRCIVHCAALSKPDQCETDRPFADTVNVSGTRNLLEAAARHGAHFVFLSTDFVFDGESGFYREEDAVAPVNYYGETKVRAEALVREYPFSWAIVRTVLVYGAPRLNRDNLLTMVAKALREGKPLHIFNDQVRTPTYVEDLVRGIVKIVETGATGTWHLSGADVRTPYEMAVETARHLGLDERLITPVDEHSFAQPARRPPKTGFDISKAKSELNYTTTSFVDGLRRTFADGTS
ncbi:SDR family oxidoreductase [Flaviaesturariibacter amylovorans]|uniref:dTDP-4-dehydrorhamnose reductase n=1 Tax=Flaviaesturariibacter amylovorans TaxID=1084520 RepID=A0ABP8GUH8_9BACT